MAYAAEQFVCEPKPAKHTVRGPEDVIELLPRLANEKREHFIAILLNARHEVIRKYTVSIGSLNASIVHPREVFRAAIIASAHSIVVVHNHPSGDPQPSDEDLAITRRLVQVGELIGIAVLDHIIIAKRGVNSLRSRNQMGGKS